MRVDTTLLEHPVGAGEDARTVAMPRRRAPASHDKAYVQRHFAGGGAAVVAEVMGDVDGPTLGIAAAANDAGGAVAKWTNLDGMTLEPERVDPAARIVGQTGLVESNGPTCAELPDV